MNTNINIRIFGLAGIVLMTGFSGIASAASKTWSNTGGDKSRAWYGVGCTVAATATASAASATGNAYADIVLLKSNSMRIAYANAGASASKNSSSFTVGYNGNIQFLGGTIWSNSQSVTVSKDVTLSASLPYISKTWTTPAGLVVSVYGIPVTLYGTASVGISASVSDTLGFASKSFSTTVAPVNVDCSAGVKASVAAGWINVAGNVKVLALSPRVAETCSWQTKGANLSSSLGYSTLGGTINLQFGKTITLWTYTLMTWPGYNNSVSLFSESAKF